jgi:hypothetical protein
MVLTVSFVLSPVTGLSCHRRPRSFLRRLDASVGASGPHDFAVRKIAPSSEAPPASTASRPTSVTIAKRPSDRVRDGIALLLFLPNRKANFFSKEGWTRRANQCRSAVGWAKRSRPRRLNARRRKACPPYELLPPPLRVGVGGSPKRVCPCGPPPPTPPRKGEGSRAAGWACGQRAPRLSRPSITRSMW